MPTPRVLIVEDDTFVALDLELIVTRHGPAEVVAVASVADARREVEQPIAFAFLDIDVLDGKTFELARHLHENKTPFVFVSGSRRVELPRELAGAPFIPKPYDPSAVTRALAQALGGNGAASHAGSAS